MTPSGDPGPGYALPRDSLSGGDARNEERYALAIESLGYGVFDWDIEAGVIRYSPVLRDMLGLPGAGLATPDGWMERLHPDDLPAYRRTLVAHLKGELPRFESDVRYRGSDGSWHWARLHGIAVRGADGRARRLVGASRDITEIKQRTREYQAARTAAALRAGEPAGESLGDREERYALALESINENIYDWDIDSGALYFSPGLRIMLGLGPDQSISLEEWAAFIHPDDRLSHRQTLVAHLKGETPRFECEFRFGTGDGMWRWARQHGIALRDAEGRARRIVGATGDITVIKQRELEFQAAKAEAAAAYRNVEETREVMQTVLDNMSDGVTLFDSNYRLKFTNQRLMDFLQFTDEMAQPGVSLMDMLMFQAQRGDFGPPHDAEKLARERFAMLTVPGGALYDRRTASGRHLEFNFKPLADGSTIAVTRDITELKDREAALAAAKESAEDARDAAERERTEAQAANQAKSTFLATMSHEIRTPMNGVLGMMEVLERQGLDANQRRTVATMRESALALLRIIDDLLDFSKIEAGRLELEETTFSLSELIESVVGTFKLQAQGKGLALATEIVAGSHDALIGDSTRLRQILFNLIGNALKFTHRGNVTVRASTAAIGEGRTLVTLAIRDTGIGLDEQQRAQLFKPFSQADSSTTRRFGGTGLGLSIVRRLAQLMGGDVNVESAPGQGSTFTVTCRLRAAPADSPLNTILRSSGSADASGEEGEPRRQLRVLVADDHPVNREVLVRQLELLGIASDAVNDGVEALVAWSNGRYAAVLVDVHMPRMDGHEFTRRMRQAEAERAPGTQRTPVIAVTANAMKGEEEHCLSIGMDAYLAKPVRLERLRATLERWLPIADEADAADGQSGRRGNSKAINREVLAAWFGDDRAAIHALLLKFRDTAIQSEQDISAASHAGDLVSLAKAAHRLKGAAQSVGAVRIGQIAATLESAGKSGDRQRCRDELGPLSAELRRALIEIGRPDECS